MIERDPVYYVTGYDGDDPSKAPFYLRSLVFDGEGGDYNTSLVDKFNEFIQKKKLFRGCSLKQDKTPSGVAPKKIVVINASHDDLPTSYETARIFADYCKEKGLKVEEKVVNSREELMKEVEEDPSSVLIMSQCVNKDVYNVSLEEELSGRGVVVVPGKVTAPGSIFSDKDSTYKLLSDNGKIWDEVARYKKIFVDGKSVEEVVSDILAAVGELEMEIGESTFFVKPHEGGGGLGGFRITKTENGYIIPDLSKVSGHEAEVHPTFINFDENDEKKLKELLWIYRLFASDEKMAANYIQVKLDIPPEDDEEALKVLKDYLFGSEERWKAKLAGMVMSAEEAHKRLVGSIKIFEKKFSRKYTPLVNEHIDFGLWGLRAHYRLTDKGPLLETMYHRVFQLGFTAEGLGYVGSDNISNKQTGDLEITRLGPINKIMVDSIGGEEKLFETLLKGAKALEELSTLVPEEESGRIPLRLQLDLATISQRIGEGNADTARGLCLASRWTEFEKNARAWLEDSLRYYAWKKGKV
ncbi:MAG: hypothetical protein HQ594_03120 [Candidatus Omnitrophica bacterium]|nr:hypothetical protein [Candidatus Omnitrophota bacterium]